MQKDLSAVKLFKREDFVVKQETRVLPRYPLHYITFRGVVSGKQDFHRAYEVKDISSQGMQLEQKMGECHIKVGNQLMGAINWRGEKIEVSGSVIWIDQSRIGLQFNEDLGIQKKIIQLLSLPNMTGQLRSLPIDHQTNHDLTKELRYWYRSEGPLEMFVWSKANNFSRCLWIYLTNFVEWDHNDGLKTGQIYRQKDESAEENFRLVDRHELNWNISEGDYLLLHDRNLDHHKLQLLKQFLDFFPKHLMDQEEHQWLKRLFVA